MAAQLLGSGGIAALLLGGAAIGDGGVVDVSLTLALAAFVDRVRQFAPPASTTRRANDGVASVFTYVTIGAGWSSSSPALSGCCGSRTRLPGCTR